MVYKARICVPTYKRKKPLCLRLLEEKDVILHFYVRQDDLESGFYEELQQNPQIVFHALSKDTKDIGDTREQILQSCVDDDIDYCVMLDDSVCVIGNIMTDNLVTETIESAIKKMWSDDYSDYVADFAFVKFSAIDNDGRVIPLNRSYATHKYFTTFPCQCHIIDVKKVHKAGIHYHSLDECGFEDANFLGDLIKAGLVVIGRKNFIFSAAYANKPKTGGNHDNLTSLKDLQDRYDKYNRMTLDYLKLDGTSIESRYRGYVGGVLSLIKWDYDFYREVLVTKRHLNEEVIANHLSTYKN